MKQTYYLLSAEEMADLVWFCMEQNLSVYTGDGAVLRSDVSAETIAATDHVFLFPEKEIPEMGLGNRFSDHAKRLGLRRTIVSDNGFVTEGGAILYTEEKQYAAAYRVVVGYLKRNCIRLSSSTGARYVGKDTYQNWKGKKTSFQFFLDQPRGFEVDGSLLDFRRIQELVGNAGLLMVENGHDFRVAHPVLDEKADNYVIYTEGAKMCPFRRGRFQSYFTESECVFLSRIKKRGRWVYRFCADSRHFEGDTASERVAALYRELEQMFRS